MPFEYAWKPIAPDCSEIELEVFLDQQKAWKKKNSQHETCTVCPVRLEEHTMHYVIYKGNSGTCKTFVNASPCQWFARSRICDQAKRGSLETHGYHTSSLLDPTSVKLNLTMKRFVRD